MSLSPSANYTGASYLGNIKENWLFQLFNQGSYLTFDGENDYIDLGATTSTSPMSLTSSEDLSIAMWVKFPVEDVSEWVFVNNSVDTAYSGFGIYKDSGNKFSIIFGDGSGLLTADYRRFRTSTTYSANTWYHVVITTRFANNGSDTVFYVNGSTSGITTQSAGSDPATTPTYASGNAYFGRGNAADPDSYAQFSIKNFAVYSGILDQTNVTAIYNSGNFLSLEENSGNYDESSNLKGYWEFNNGETLAQDLSDNVATGTIIGAKYEGFLPLAMRDTTIDDVFYYGVVRSSPSIRHSIDVIKSKSKTGNISVNLINAKYQGDDLSAELFLGSNGYYNRTVKVYSQLNEMSDIVDCLQLYHGRLADISHNDSSIKLSVAQKSPWDDKVVPDIKSTTGRSFPIVYGAYTKNTSAYNSEAYAEAMGQTVFPVEVDVWGFNYRCLMHKDIGSTDTTLHYYEESLDAFLPLASSNDAVEYGSGHTVGTKWDLLRHFKFKPIDTVVRASGWDSTYQVLYAFDGVADEDSTTTPSTFAQFDFEDTNAETQSSTTSNLWKADTHFDIPGFDDIFYNSGSGSNKLTCEIRYTMTGFYGIHNNEVGLNTNTFKIYDNGRYGGSIIRAAAAGIDDGDVFSTNGSFANTSANQLSAAVTITEQTASHDMLDDLNQYGYEDGFWIRFEREASRHNDYAGGQNIGIHGVLKVYDIRFKTSLKVTGFNTTPEGMKRLKEVKQLYSGADGLTASWDGDAITLGHEAHRDLLIRYAGMPTIEPENWAALELDRSTWTIRHWQNKEIPLIKYLEKLQYEFGFIHKIDPSGKSKYVWIHGTAGNNAFQATDVDVTLSKSDISSLSISTSPVSQILTKAVMRTQRHPATEEHLTTTTATNATPRATYNIKSKENIATINLDALTLAPATSPATDKQADFYSYYSQSTGDVKKIIECEIINIQKGYLLETGDIVKFEDMPVDPFADNWADYYMVTNLIRSPGKIKIKLREVG